MNRWQTIRLVAILALIFAVGGFCGWWLRDQHAAQDDGGVAANRRRTPAANMDRLLTELTTDLNLTSDQQKQIRALLDDWLKDFQGFSQQRVRDRSMLFHKYAPLIRTNLTSEQQVLYDRKTQEGERRLRMMQRRAQ
jgi:hypothetical protein